MNPRARPFTVTFQTVSTRIVTTGRAPVASASASRHPRVAHAPRKSLRKVTVRRTVTAPVPGPPARPDPPRQSLTVTPTLANPWPPWSVLGSVLDRGQLLEPRQRPCGVGHNYVVIDQAGKVAKCHMEIERTLGDVFHDDPLQLVRNDTRTTLNLLVDEKEGCRDCTWRYWCSGGCPVATFRATGRYDIKSPNCAIYKAIYPEALRLEGLRLLKYAAI